MLINSPLKSIFEDQLQEMESLGYPAANCSNLFQYWLLATASQFIAKAVMTLLEVSALFIKQFNSAAFLILPARTSAYMFGQTFTLNEREPNGRTTFGQHSHWTLSPLSTL